MKTITKNKTYQLPTSLVWLVRDAEDQARLSFHVKSDEYFATLSTALSFVEEKLAAIESIQNHPHTPSQELWLVRQLRDDLLYMHENYTIEKKQ